MGDLDWLDQTAVLAHLQDVSPVHEFDLDRHTPKVHDPTIDQSPSNELHVADRQLPVRVYVDPALDGLGRCYTDYGYAFNAYVIVLREWNEQVLLHELLHAILGGLVPRSPDTQYGFLYEHNIVNAVEVALAPLVTFRLEAPCICGDGDGVGFCFGVPGYSNECKACLALDPGGPCLAVVAPSDEPVQDEPEATP